MRKRWAFAFPLLILFHVALSMEWTWNLTNALVGGGAMWEYSKLHGTILDRAHIGRNAKYSVLRKELISKLTNIYISIIGFYFTHIVFYMLPNMRRELIIIALYLTTLYIKYNQSYWVLKKYLISYKDSKQISKTEL